MRLPRPSFAEPEWTDLTRAMAVWEDKIVAVTERGAGDLLLITAGGRFIRAGMFNGTWLVEEQPVQENPRG